jgi:uncharacterized protein YgbK (DUF1537 family)
VSEHAPATPRRARLAFYGDDFTGSTDALEALAGAGLRCALFLQPPQPDSLEAFGELDAIGLAGYGRAMTPGEMDEALPPLLQALAQVAPIVHYKVCSTFDSAPHVGSIGRVIEIARRTLGCGPVPIVAGNPALGRYCLFGHLYARSGTDGRVYRIDRHPIMRVHPVTPMDESDLALHIARQAPLRFAGVTLADLDRGPEAAETAWRAALETGAEAVLIDAASPAHLTEVGRLLQAQVPAQKPGAPLFIVGSSGLQYALTQWWRASGQAGSSGGAALGSVEPVDQVLAVSGSASALTALQIEAGLAAGLVEVAVQAHELLDAATWPAVREALVARAAAVLAEGRSPLLHTARGPDDPRIGRMVEALVAAGRTPDAARLEGGRLLGQRLAELTRAILERVRVPRLLLAGGDTSSLVMQALGPQALTVAARLSPGAPLCRLHGGDALAHGMQAALKGGQMGGPDYFERAWRGAH